MEDFRLTEEYNIYLPITISITAALCRIESNNEIEDFGVVREDWFKTFLELPNGIELYSQIADFQYFAAG